MRLAKVIQIMKQDRTIILFNEHWTDEPELQISGNQWIGNGFAMFNLEGTPRIENKAQFQRLYDIPEKKVSEYYFDQRSQLVEFGLKDYENNEEMADPLSTTIGIRDYVLVAMRGENGTIMFINSRYLDPFRGEEGVEYTIRRTKSNYLCLCVRQEMELKAVVMPIVMKDSGKCHNTAYELELVLNEMQAQIQADAQMEE